MGGGFAFLTKGFTLKVAIADAVSRFLFPTEEPALGILGAASTLSRVTDIFVRDAGIAANIRAGRAVWAGDRAVLADLGTALEAGTRVGIGIVSDGAKRTVATPLVLFAALSVEAAGATFGHMTASKAETDPLLVRASANFLTVAVAGDHFTGTGNRLTGASLGANRKRATTVFTGGSAFTGVVVVTSSTLRSWIKRAGAAITSIGALVIGQATVDAEISHAAIAFSASLNWAGAVLLA